MKVLWQQILAFLVVLLTALTISAIRISDYVSEQVYSEAEARLLQYGQTIMAYDFTRSDLAIVSQVLTDEDVYVQFYLSDGRLIYPTYNDRSAVKITAKELADLQAGKTLQLRQTRRFGQNDEVVPLVTVLLPYYEETSDFPPGFIGLSTTVANLNSRVNAVQQDIYVSFLLAGILGVLLSVGYAYYQTRKIQTLQQATRQITQGNYEVNLSLDSKDEFGDLAHDFRLMASSLKNAQEEIKRQEKLR
ncbi:MAG: HAMP domain-containing protein, partial [Aerococcaceae bacterium]|nr:HAMP domain-containing protein [Aerococcaceae bacterium]